MPAPHRAGPLAEPWRRLPIEVLRVIRPELSVLRHEILLAIDREIPEHGCPLEGGFDRGVRAVDEALRQFVALIEDPDGRREEGREVFSALGAAEAHAGRGLDALQAAYRVGARAAWRTLADAGIRAGLDPATLCLLAESILAYLDELSADSVEGYTEAQAALAGERERRCRQLLLLLTSQSPPHEKLALRAAREAGWSAPSELVAVACWPDELERIAGRLPPDTLAGTIDGHGCIAVAAIQDSVWAERLARAVEGSAATAGPTVPWQEFGRSWRLAVGALDALEAGVLPDDRLLRADEHLLALTLHQGQEPLAELARRRLSPLAGLRPKGRERALETLAAWLAHPGQPKAMAKRLFLHPQSVHYRLGQLRERFGDSLDDPQARLELALAVWYAFHSPEAGLRVGDPPKSSNALAWGARA